jgi:hypothetical protein
LVVKIAKVWMLIRGVIGDFVLWMTWWCEIEDGATLEARLVEKCSSNWALSIVGARSTMGGSGSFGGGCPQNCRMGDDVTCLRSAVFVALYKFGSDASGLQKLSAV